MVPVYRGSTGLAIALLIAMIPGGWTPLMASAPSSVAVVQPEAIAALLATAKQEYRRAEFKAAIATYQQVLTLAQQTGDRAAQIDALSQLGDIDLWIGQIPAAESRGQQALKLARESGDHKSEGKVLALIAAVQRYQQQYGAALETLKTALAINQQVGDVQGETRSRLLIGIMLYSQKQYPQALEAFQQALKVAQADHNQDEMAHLYDWLAITYRELKDLKQAEALSQQQQTLSQTIGYRLAEYDGLSTIVASGQQQKQPERVLQAYQKQIEIAQAANNPWFEKDARVNIGFVYFNQNQLPQGLAYLQKALVVARTIDDNAVGAVQNSIGVAYFRAKQYPQAIAAYQEALADYQKVGDLPSNLAQVWDNVGNAYYSAAQYPKSLAAFQQALMVYQKLGDRAKAINVFQEIAVTYRQLKQLDNAIKTYQQALEFYQKTQTDRPADLAQVWINLGDTYRNAKQYPQALAAYQQAKAIAQKIPDRAIELQVILSEGILYVGQGISLNQAAAYQEAIVVLEKAINPLQQAQIIAKELKNTQLEQIAIDEIRIAQGQRGFAFDDQQRYPEAIAAFQQGLSTWRQYRDRLPAEKFWEQEQATLTTLGDFYDDNGQYATALTTYQAALKIAEQRNIPADQVELLEFIASSYKDIGENAKALAASQRALTLAREKLKQSPEAEMDAVNKVGQILAALGQYDAAIAHYQQSLAIARTLKNVSSERAALGNIGTVYNSRGQYLQALDFQQQALAIVQAAIQQLQSGDNQAVKHLCGEAAANLGASGQQSCLQRFQIAASSALNSLASVYDSLGRYKEALNGYEQALKIAQQYQALGRQTTLLNNIGNLYVETGNYVKALDTLQKSLAIAVTTGARPVQAITLNNIGRVYQEQGQTTQALDYFQQTFALARAIQAPDVEATALNNLGSLYETQGNYDRALDFYQQSLAISRKRGLNFGTELNNIAYVYSDQGRYPQALEQLQQALEIARKVGDRPQAARVLRNIGAAYMQQANYAKAQEFYQQARVLSQAMGNRASELVDLLAQGQLYLNLGQYPQALDRFQQAQMLSHEFGEKGTEATAISNIAGVYRKQEKYPQALQFYQQALILKRETGNVAAENIVLQRMAQIYEKQGNPAQAVALLQSVLQVQRQIGARPSEAITLNILGRADTAQGNFAAAQTALQQALAITQSVNDRTTQAEVLSHLGQLFAKQNQPELAIVFYKQSVSITETIRHELRTLPPDQQQSYTETVAVIYRELADLLLQGDRILEAQQVLDRLKLQELNQYLRNVRGGSTDTINFRKAETALLQQFSASQQNVVQLMQRLNQLQTQSGLTAAETAELQKLYTLQKQLTANTNEFFNQPEVKTLISQLRNASIDPSPELLKHLQANLKQVKNQDAALLYPVIFPDRLELILFTANAPPLRRTVILDKFKLKLNTTLRDFLRNIADPSSDPRPPAQQLYQWIIAPIAADLEAAHIKTIIYAPDSQLRYIPLAALHDGKQWLIQRYQIDNITAESVTNLQPAARRSLQVLAGAASQGAEVKVAETRYQLGALPNVAKEVGNIAAIVPGTQTFLDSAFDLTALEPRFAAFRVLHFATHGHFDVDSKEKSFLLFGGKTATGQAQIATLDDVKNWSLAGVDLVVLSACETGLSERIGTGPLGTGQEILGLGYQFQTAGAKATISTLWQVDDRGTQVLMSAFYQYLQTGNYSVAAALQQAQRSLIAGKAETAVGDRAAGMSASAGAKSPPIDFAELAHPYYWAPFILIGNGL